MRLAILATADASVHVSHTGERERLSSAGGTPCQQSTQQSGAGGWPSDTWFRCLRGHWRAAAALWLAGAFSRDINAVLPPGLRRVGASHASSATASAPHGVTSVVADAEAIDH
jgi:hypothetical protein